MTILWGPFPAFLFVAKNSPPFFLYPAKSIQLPVKLIQQLFPWRPFGAMPTEMGTRGDLKAQRGYNKLRRRDVHMAKTDRDTESCVIRFQSE